MSAGATLRTDVCVVGAGPAGLTTAHQLVSSGLEVIVLEAGSATPPEGGEDLTSTRSVGLAYAIEESRVSGLGGSSLHWDIETPSGPKHVRLRELDDLDFEARPGVPRSGWPFSKAELRTSYRRAWEVFGLQPQDEEEDQSGDFAAPLQRVAFSFGPASTFISRLPDALRAHAGATIVTDARATDIRTDEAAGRVSSLICRTSDGSSFNVAASAYVLAAGGIENARLLLASRSSHDEGIGNGHDQVGRHFMEHPHPVIGMLLGRPPGGDARWGAISSRDGQAYEWTYRVHPGLVRREGLLNTVALIARRATSEPLVRRRRGGVDQEATDLVSHAKAALRAHRLPVPRPADVARLVRALPSVSEHVLRQGITRGGRAPGVRQFYDVRMMVEQVANAESRVRLVAARDRFGVPEAELEWRLEDLDERSVTRMADVIGPALERHFDGRFTRRLQTTTPIHLDVGWHHLGTTRMSTSPVDGVVDRDARVHGIENLYVAGSSVFPTGGYANPTLTIVALALRLADRLVEELS